MLDTSALEESRSSTPVAIWIMNPYGVADDFRRETVSVVTGSGALHEIKLMRDAEGFVFSSNSDRKS